MPWKPTRAILRRRRVRLLGGRGGKLCTQTPAFKRAGVVDGTVLESIETERQRGELVFARVIRRGLRMIWLNVGIQNALRAQTQ